MSEASFSSVDQQVLDWVTSHRDLLTENFVSELRTINTPYYRSINDNMREWIARTYLDKLTDRLRGKPMDALEIKNIYAGRIKEGVPLNELSDTADRLQNVVIATARRHMLNQDQVLASLEKKVTYFFTLAKTGMAAALIEVMGKPSGKTSS
ncbi:MAG TPA: hypothetical protein VH186_25665 [Chloroflexia bacterium]|nr:hypothetical protein [Chloroflexia bacterium]